MRRIGRGFRPEDADVIITQLPAAQAISATWLSTVDTFGHRAGVDQQCQRLPVERGHQPEAAQREDHRGADQRLLVDQCPADAQAGRQSEETGDHPDDQPNASPRRTWTIDERSDGSRPSR